jgi:hypothetical protein
MPQPDAKTMEAINSRIYSTRPLLGTVRLMLIHEGLETMSLRGGLKRQHEERTVIEKVAYGSRCLAA